MAIKLLPIVNEIPKDSVILVVDLVEEYFDEIYESMEEDELRITKQRIDERLFIMKNRLKELKDSGCKIYSASSGFTIHKGFEDCISEYFDSWYSPLNGSVPEIYKNLSEDDILSLTPLRREIADALRAEDKDVIVVGLWKELCVYLVTRLLNLHGVPAYMYGQPDLVLENGIMWLDEDIITLDIVCERDGVTPVELVLN